METVNEKEREMDGMKEDKHKGIELMCKEEEKRTENEYSTPQRLTTVSLSGLKEADTVYTGLKRSSEDIYYTAGIPAQSPSDPTGLQRQLCVLRWLCVSLLLLCIVLGAVLTALLLRGLQSDCSSVDYRAPPRPQADCLTLREQPAIPPTIDCTGEQCTRCKQDWLFFEGVCFLLSYDRMSWEDSRQDCRERGGDLAVIPDLKTQEFLSRRGSLFYWIGLTRDSTGQWTWTNGTTVTKGYWAPPGAAGVSSGRCAALIGRSNPKLSWAPAPCSHLAFRVCQSAPRWAP